MKALLVTNQGTTALIVMTVLTTFGLLKVRALWQGRLKILGAEQAARSEGRSLIPPIELVLARMWIVALPVMVVAVVVLWLHRLPDWMDTAAAAEWRRIEERVKGIGGAVLGWGAVAALLVALTGYPDWLIAPPYRRRRKTRE